MKIIKLAVPSFTFVALALMLGGCVGADAESDPDPNGTPVDVTPWKGATRPELAEVLSAHPAGVQINANQIAWDNGKVVLNIPDEAHPENQEAQARATVHGCPRGWFCFYQHENFGGRRLQFSDCSSGGVAQYLRNYGFENQTTSWVANKSLSDVNVNDSDTNGFNLWDEDGNSQSSNVGARANDQADWFICYL